MVVILWTIANSYYSADTEYDIPNIAISYLLKTCILCYLYSIRILTRF